MELGSAGQTISTAEGEMRQRISDLDWSATPLGPRHAWPQSLQLAVEMMLASAFPMIVLWSRELIQIYNDAYVPIIGAKHPAALGKGNEETWPEVWHINEPIFERVLRGETVAFEDARYPLHRNAAGAEDVYLTISYSPIPSDDEGVGGVLVTMLETTGRVAARRMEEDRERLMRELSVERSRLEEIFRQAPAFLAVMRGPEHVFELVNDAYLQLVGKRDLIGKPAREAFPEVVEQGFLGILDDVLRGGTPFVARELPVALERTRGGELEERFLDFVYQPLTDATGTPVGVVAHGSDVTDQVLARREVERVNKQLEASTAELRASERRLRELFDQAPVAIAVLSGPEHTYTIASPRYVETPGGGRPLIGRTVLEVFPELSGQGLIQTMDRVYATGQPYFAAERLVRIDRDGDGLVEDYYYNIGYQPLRDAEGRVYAIASVAYEVTEQIRARQELEAAREMAENARLEAETANQAKSAFLTMMSHELRTPLNAVAGYSDLMLMGVRGPITDGQREDLERIKRSGQYLLGLINDVLNFARLGAGQVEFRVEDVDVAPLLASLDDLILPQIEGKGLRYRHDGCAPGVAVRADPEKVRQILLNLLANAVKFTEADGEIALVCTLGERVVRIAVRDTGRGIPADQLARIFEPFVQVDRHLTHASQQGVGLGLAISRDLAVGMGGTLSAESEVGRGSVFTLTLPRAAAVE
jgi:PAS domain S-box-containing protein